MTDDQARAELARDIEMEQHFERQALAERYFAFPECRALEQVGGS